MQALVIEWVMARLVKVIGVSVGLSVLVGSCVMRDHKQQTRGAAKVVEASQKQGAKANAASEKVRRAAAAPGAAERLRRESCRDC